MPLNTDTDYFIARPSVVLRTTAGGRKATNHLILGDWLRYLGETQGDHIKIKCRGDEGWVHRSDITDDRALEVNFVDIGQGDGCHIVTPEDEVILIDAGVGSNMNRFLTWRYNLRDRNVARAADFDDEKDPQDPFPIDYVIVSHPDNDHYLGFRQVFDNPKFSFSKVFHNGIVERPSEDEDPGLSYPDDLGGYVEGGPKMLWDVAHEDARVKEIIAAHPSTTKQLLSTYRALLKNSASAQFTALTKSRHEVDADTSVFFDKFDDTHPSLSFEVLGPVTEPVTHNGQTRDGLRKLGAESKTKNGHSVVLKLRYGKLSVMLGGDLNKPSQDYLLRLYGDAKSNTSSLEKKIAKYEAQGDSLSASDRKKLDKAKTQRADIIAKARETFQVDVAKACHHGSSHVLDTFLACLNPVVTVISSGDEESHSHPRPDALGSFGKHGRGRRPLIFSTELARSTRGFTPIIRYLDMLRVFEAQLEAESDPRERRKIEKEMQEKKDRNVAVYGMITLRALGDVILVAQRLEVPRNEGAKWDLYELRYNDNLGMYEYAPH